MSRHRLPSLGGLKAFEAAARLGRMSLAARELNVTSGAVSRRIRHLEQELGVTLFQGPKGALRLTARGLDLASVLSDAFRQIEAAISPYFNETTGALLLSCPGTLAARWLIPRLRAFQQVAPQIQIQLSTSNHSVDFEREPYDLAIRLVELPLPEDSRTSLLFPEYIGPVASPHLLAPIHPLNLATLAPLPVLGTHTRPNIWDIWAEQFGIDSAQTVNAFDHFYYTLEAVKAGLGICVAPWPLVMDDLSRGELLAPFGFVPSGYAYVLARRQLRSAKMEQVCNWLINEARCAVPQDI